MFLDAVEIGGTSAAALEVAATYKWRHVYAPWEDWAPTYISHHGAICCESAREWLAAYDLSMLNGASTSTGPRWIRQRFEWGPSVYPIHWCDALRKESIDCGIHAALSYEAFATRGVECFRVQMVQEFDGPAARQWRANWARNLARTDWICESLIYHEGCAIEIGDSRIKIWDPSAGWWLDPKTVTGYGSTRAIRLFAESEEPPFRWGRHLVRANEWVELDEN